MSMFHFDVSPTKREGAVSILFCQEVISAYTYTYHHYVNWISSSVFLSKDDTQSALESLYSNNIISSLLQLAKRHSHIVPQPEEDATAGMSVLTYKCISHMMNIWSELVLTSSKFLNQVNSRLFLLRRFLEY